MQENNIDVALDIMRSFNIPQTITNKNGINATLQLAIKPIKMENEELKEKLIKVEKKLEKAEQAIKEMREK